MAWTLRNPAPRAPRHLSAAEQAALSSHIPRVDLENALLHEGRVPWYLMRGYGAIVRGNHIYLRHGVYAAGTLEGLALLAHELTHVGQYRRGMTVLSYLASTWRGYANSRYEKAAFAAQARVVEMLGGTAVFTDPETPTGSRT